ncbi:MAG: type II toxin-antitoxin system PemK/MazF family toxin [Clostridia bacterium]
MHFLKSGQFAHLLLSLLYSLYPSLVVCALVTSQIKRLDLKEHVLLPKLKGLPKQSMVMVEQRATVDRKQLEDYRGHIDWFTFQKINRALRKCENANKRDYEMKW